MMKHANKNQSLARKLRLAYSAGVISALTLSAVPAFAQSTQTAGDSTNNEIAGRAIIEEIIVNARKRSESLQDVPEAVTAFGPAQIEKAGLRTMRDFAQLTPNIIISNGSGAGYPNIMVRGLAMAQGGEAPLAFVVDGIQISHPAFINRDYGDVAQVEVLRGPQGSLYGRNAIGGAINITTRQPGNEFEGRAKVAYGNAESTYLSGDVSGPIVDNKILFRLGGTYNTTDGEIRNRTSGKLMDWGRSYFLNGRLIFNLSEASSLDFRANYGEDDLGGLSAEIVANSDWNDFDPGFFVNDPRQTDERELWDVSAKFDYSSDTFTFTSITGYSEMDEHQAGDADFSAAPFLLQDVNLTVESFTQELRLSSEGDDRFRWLVGAFYQDRDTDNFLNIPLDDGSGKPIPGVFAVQAFDVGTSESWAVFGSLNYDILSNLELTLGLRYDEDKRTSEDLAFAGSATQNTFSATQPKVQIAYKPTPDLNIYASYGEGFSSGGFNAFFAGPAARLYDGQTSENYEFGIKGSIASMVDYSASVFRVYYDQQQLFFIIANPPSQNVVNIDQTRVNGAELELSAAPTERLTLSAAFGWTDSEIRDFSPDPTAVGNQTPQSSKYTLNLTGEYTHPLNSGMELRAYMSYRKQSSVYWDAANTLRTDSQDFVNLRLFLEAGNWSAGFYGENLTDSQFPTQAAADALGTGVSLRIPSTRRTYGIEASYRF